MTSIRKRVLISVLFVLTLATAISGVVTYYSIRNEMDELYDGNMRQLAVVASGMVSETGAHNAPAYSGQWPRGEQIFLIQIWDGGKLQYSTHPIADLPLQPTSGFGRIFFHEKKWSYYQENIRGRTIQVAQELKERRDVIREVYNAIIIPTVVQFPVSFALLWFLISYGFRPLTRISNLIQERTATYMQPIPSGDVPQEIHSLVIALNDLLGRLNAAMESQRQFTADAAHELRTPLTAVRLQLDLLQRSKTEDERIESLSALERGVSRSIHLVQQLLELARQEPENTLRPFTSINLNELVLESIENHQALAHDKNITLEHKLEDVGFLQGDAPSLSVMIGNLLGNAIIYTKPNGHVLVRTFLQDGNIGLDVSDSGIGISEADRERIFYRFFRVTGTDTPGSGLGLSIVKNIADHHNAKISIMGGLNGSGTCFRLIFPSP